MTSALIERFRLDYSDGVVFQGSEEELDQRLLSEMIQRQTSARWMFDATPRFSLEYKGQCLEIVKGVVVNGGFEGKPFKDLVFRDTAIDTEEFDKKCFFVRVYTRSTYHCLIGFF